MLLLLVSCGKRQDLPPNKFKEGDKVVLLEKVRGVIVDIRCCDDKYLVSFYNEVDGNVNREWHYEGELSIDNGQVESE